MDSGGTEYSDRAYVRSRALPIGYGHLCGLSRSVVLV